MAGVYVLFMKAGSTLVREFILSLGFVPLFLVAVVSLDAQEVAGQRALLDQYCIACHNGRTKLETVNLIRLM